MDMDFAFDRIAAQLQQPGDGFFRETEWLAASWQQPDDFVAKLVRYSATHSHAPLKSSPEAGYDLYHDMVLRHPSSTRPALLWTDGEPGLHALTYAELHAACSQRCAAWTAQGVKSGDALCVIASVGKELLIDVLSGLRLGMRVSLLPPRG